MIKALTLSMFLQTLWFISDAAVLPDNYPAAISDQVPAELLDNPIVQAGIISILTNPDVQKAVLDVITNKEVHKQVGNILKNIFDIAQNISKGIGDILTRPLIIKSQQNGAYQRYSPLDSSLPPTNMLDIVKDLDLETLVPADNTNTSLQAIVEAVEGTPKEELVTFLENIEDNHDALKDMFGLETTNPAVVKLVTEIVNAQIEKLE